MSRASNNGPVTSVYAVDQHASNSRWVAPFVTRQAMGLVRNHRRRLAVRAEPATAARPGPGISGLAQINGIDMSVPEKLAEWDARYGALQSLLLDARIIIATALGRGQGDRVAAER